MYKFIVTDSFDNCRYFKTKKELEEAMVGDLKYNLEFEEEEELSIYELGKQYQIIKSTKVVPV